MAKRKQKKIKSIPFESFKDLTVGQVRELTKQFKKDKKKKSNKFKVPNVQLVRDYGKKTPL